MNDDELRDYRREVKDYWDRCRDDCEYSRDQQMDDYINNFLKRELEHARGFPRRIPKQPEEARKILILLVGYSLEPLLQSICAWQPKKVVLVLNEYYGENTGGKSWGLFIEKLTNTLVIKKLLNSKPDFASSIVLEDDKPEFVFRQLRKTTLNLLRDFTRDQIVIDITGGKKSMVAGAYLFGAYANIDVSYVDFEDKAYDPKYGKPYGDGCTIGILPNPYERFGLRDWQRVEELYKRHAFQAARESVATLIREMRGLFEASEIRAAKLLRQVLRVYESWDRGDYRQALRVANKTPGFNHPTVIPTVIPVMGEGSPQWPNAKNAKDFKKQANKLANGQDDKLTDSLYKQERLILYVK